MGEGCKQVRVDNWGVFFLQRLQSFFNKTDYCDLTLQFEGNVQLKVHRLVMNACTEYFMFLEQTCVMIDEVLIMPSDLQSDVILPIVNFMYTGKLEFHVSIFDRLYRAADLMSITILTKLLDAQKSSIAQAKLLKKPTIQPVKRAPVKQELDLPDSLPGRKLPLWKRKTVPTPVPRGLIPPYYTEQKRFASSDCYPTFDNTPKPSRFEWPDEELPDVKLFDTPFDDGISYTSKPLLTQEDEPRPSTSFDRLKEAPNRRSDDPDDKRHNRKLKTDFEDDVSDGVFDDDDGESEELQKRKNDGAQPIGPTKRVRFNINEKENQVKQVKYSVTPTGKTSGDMDHTKIISEVLKKYPKLLQKNKNIRVKILAKSNTSTESVDQAVKQVSKPLPDMVKQSPPKPFNVDLKKTKEPTWKCTRCSTPQEPVEFVLYYLYRKHMTDVHKEKFDSRMCKYCGHKSAKHNMLMYHQYTRHGIAPPPAYNFPKCNQCPYIALTETLLIRHTLNHTNMELQCVECKVAYKNMHYLKKHIDQSGHTDIPKKSSFDCQYCSKRYQSGSNLFSHIKMQHREDARRDGVVSIDELEEEDNDDIEFGDKFHSQSQLNDVAEKSKPIKILSNVKLPPATGQCDESGDIVQNQTFKLEPSSEAEALSNVASGIATSLGLVDVVVLDDNQQYIIRSNNSEGIGQSEYLLPQISGSNTFTTNSQIGQVITSQQNTLAQSILTSSDITSTDELVMVLTDQDYNNEGGGEIINTDNSNIVVLYSHPIEGQGNQFIATSQGNLVLNSQTGLIQLQDAETVVSPSNQFISTTVAPTTNSIETIEMIQQEISDQNNMTTKDNGKVEGSHDSLIVNEDVPELNIEYSTVNNDAPIVYKEAHQEEAAHSEVHDSDQVDCNTSLEEEAMEIDENATHATADSDKDVTTEYEQLPASQHQMPPTKTETLPQPTNSNVLTTCDAEVPATTETQPLPEEPMEVIQDENDVEAPETSYDTVDHIESIQNQSNRSELNNTDIPTGQVAQVMAPIDEVPIAKETTTESSTGELQGTPVLTQETAPNEEETEPQSTPTESVPEQNDSIAPHEVEPQDCEDKSLQCAAESSRPDQSEELKHSSSSDEKEEQEKETKQQKVDCHESAKNILDDWEDTDSQQSEIGAVKSGSTVNKLIDDWDDDDDEAKSNGL